MSEVNYVLSEIGAGAYLATWAGLANGDTGQPVRLAGAADRSVQFSGTFGAGGTVICEGSNNSANYQPLTDPQGNAISKTEASLEAISEPTVLARPRVSAGDGTTSISIYLLMRR